MQVTANQDTNRAKSVNTVINPDLLQQATTVLPWTDHTIHVTQL